MKLKDEISELRVNVAHAQAEFEGELQDLRDQVSELQPNNNYVRINNLRTVIREEIVSTLSAAIHHTNRHTDHGC